MNSTYYIDIINNLCQKRLTQEEVSLLLTKSGNLTKSEVIQAYKELKASDKLDISDDAETTFKTNIRMKRVRTLSGVTTVTVLTAPYYCPGKCIFCPSDVKMPKSYLSDEPGAQRALANKFDPYMQTFSRLNALDNIGHPVDKVELIVLGGTWSVYPVSYQIWFIKRCFDAMNDYPTDKSAAEISEFSRKDLNTYFSSLNPENLWMELESAQRLNEVSKSRCVGLSIETRPDEINFEEVLKIRRLGATKIQLGVQSMNDEVLKLNCRGHDVSQTRDALELIRSMGFKLQIHWMANLMGSSPEQDIEDYKKLFSDTSMIPDEAKIYPCSLIKNSPLYQFYLDKKWHPYSNEELKLVVSECIKNTPRWCRLSRVFRDIPSDYIEVGVKATNFRQIAEKELSDNLDTICEIRHREIREEVTDKSKLDQKITKYETKKSTEYFIEFVTSQDKLCGFLRLSLPKIKPQLDEISDSAMIREIHVYGQSMEISKSGVEGVQHLGLGEKLIETASEIVSANKFQKLSVISAIGTRVYYRKKGFVDGALYMHKTL
jgi:elongator complex protein 3